MRLFKFAGRGIEICFERRRRERSLKGGKKTLKKEKKLKKSLDKEKEICPNGRLFHLKKGARKKVTQRWREKRSSLKFTKYDCANQESVAGRPAGGKSKKQL